MSGGQHAAPVPGQEHRALHWGVLVAVALLLAVMVSAFHGRQQAESQEAHDKAAELTTALAGAGYPVPSANTVVGLFGTDGGAACVAPGQALRTALAKGALVNGAAYAAARSGDENVCGHGALPCASAPKAVSLSCKRWEGPAAGSQPAS